MAFSGKKLKSLGLTSLRFLQRQLWKPFDFARANHILWKFILSSDGYFTLLFLIVGSTFNGVSAIWLKKLTVELNNKSTGDSDDTAIYHGLFFYGGSFMLGYVFSTIAKSVSTGWRVGVIQKYMQKFIKFHRNAPLQWFNPSAKGLKMETIKVSLQVEIGRFIDASYVFIDNALKTFISSVFLSVIIADFVVLYFEVAVLFGVVVFFAFKKAFFRRYHLQHRSKGLLELELGGLWDNLTLGNIINVSTIESRWNYRMKKFMKESRRMAGLNGFLMCLMFLVVFLPIQFGIFWYVKRNIHNTGKLFAVAALLPLQMQVAMSAVQMLQSIFMYVTSKSDMLDALIMIEKKEEIGKEALERGIGWDQIVVRGPDGTKSTFKNFDHFIRHVDGTEGSGLLKEGGKEEKEEEEELSADSFPHVAGSKPVIPGRWRIIAPGDCGQRNILSLLKVVYGAKAFYLPSQNSFRFEKDARIADLPEAMSQEGRMKSQLDRLWLTHVGRMELETDSGERVTCLLLDRWNAFMDEKMERELSKKLDEIARDIAVIETQNREDASMREMRAKGEAAMIGYGEGSIGNVDADIAAFVEGGHDDSFHEDGARRRSTISDLEQSETDPLLHSESRG
eukprot:TRINITY_DN5883_c0_g1_i1.p1 TRINITY_DN5883_c0_g1~~TRINITY_DN5883_c0_g1_i1.p1  ORF type:complete len:620 (-),score=167.53 TRINITY_DN5883_c0_g1_i1:76-1935(-)